jgi:hypothetical protein
MNSRSAFRNRIFTGEHETLLYVKQHIAVSLPRNSWDCRLPAAMEAVWSIDDDRERHEPDGE